MTTQLVSSHARALAAAVKELVERTDTLSGEMRGSLDGIKESVAEMKTDKPDVPAHISSTLESLSIQIEGLSDCVSVLPTSQALLDMEKRAFSCPNLPAQLASAFESSVVQLTLDETVKRMRRLLHVNPERPERPAAETPVKPNAPSRALEQRMDLAHTSIFNN